MALIDTISDYYWREWARRLADLAPSPQMSSESYLNSLERLIDDMPVDDAPLSSDDRRSLLLLLLEHRTTIAHERERVARQARDSSLPGALGGLVSAANATAAILAAVVQAGLAVVGITADNRLRRLERQSDRLTERMRRIGRELL